MRTTLYSLINLCVCVRVFFFFAGWDALGPERGVRIINSSVIQRLTYRTPMSHRERQLDVRTATVVGLSML